MQRERRSALRRSRGRRDLPGDASRSRAPLDRLAHPHQRLARLLPDRSTGPIGKQAVRNQAVPGPACLQASLPVSGTEEASRHGSLTHVQGRLDACLLSRSGQHGPSGLEPLPEGRGR